MISKIALTTTLNIFLPVETLIYPPSKALKQITSELKISSEVLNYKKF